MRNTLAFLAAAAIAVGAVGYYLDWFSIRSVPGHDGHRTYSVDVNTEKMEEDVRKAEHKIEHKIEEKAEKSKTDLEPAVPPRMPEVEVIHTHNRNR